MVKELEPFAQLLDIAGRSVEKAQDLPAQMDIKTHWTGIGFSLGGERFVAPMGEVSEILAQPQFTRLPGVHSWVRGVSNVRGRLLPLIDLEGFFGGNLGPRKNRRVLALEMGDLYSGLIVSEVYGMQHIPVDNFSDEIPETTSEYKSFLAGSYQHKDSVWAVFSPYKLAKDTRFFNAAES